jgi:hypothetical protein
MGVERKTKVGILDPGEDFSPFLRFPTGAAERKLSR